ncbi:unnamed protein product [Gongylonema pulchrum]|uniref:NR LBD domain-containing protein n=1 Tax=Gongylonema pulchrum TaxID=637853 RepID=A0A183DPE0_9BILA|nr:unnamed protein product [Gongylonema pulchrum]
MGDEGTTESGGERGSVDGESGSADGERGSAPSSVSSKDVVGTLDENPVWTRIRDRVTGPSESDNINLACEESMGMSSPECSPSPECRFPSADEAGPSTVSIAMEVAAVAVGLQQLPPAPPLLCLTSAEQDWQLLHRRLAVTLVSLPRLFHGVALRDCFALYRGWKEAWVTGRGLGVLKPIVYMCWHRNYNCSEPEPADVCADASPNSCLHQAFTASMHKRNDEALEKLQEAIDNNESFDIDDISLVDNVFSYKFNNSAEVQEKICICEEWLKFLVKITPIATSRWLSHYQFSIYYTYHMVKFYYQPVQLSLVFRHYDNKEEKKRFYNISLPLFTSLLQATALIPETSEEVVNTKLDVLLSISFIAVLFYDVSDSEIERYIQREMRLLGTVAVGNYSTEASTLMVQKVYRIGNNLDERKRLLGIAE